MPSLLIDIGANIARLQQDMAKATHTVDGFAKTAKTAFGLFAGYLSTSAITGFVKQTLDAADSLAKLSQKVGISVEDLSEYKHIAELSGASIETFAKGMQILSRNMLDTAQGTGEARDAFKLLGISVTDSEGRMRSNKEVMLDVAERFSKMESGATKTALAMKIFGKSGAELIPTLDEGRDGLKKLGEEVDALGIRMSTDLAQAAEEVNDNLDRMAKGAQGAGIQLMQALMPALQDITQALVKATEGFALFIGQTEKARLTRKRMAVLDELEEVERLLAKGPSWWDKFKAGGMQGESGDLPSIVLGDKEEWKRRKQELDAELQDISRMMADLSKPKAPTVIGSKLGPTDDEIKKAQKAADDWLKKYLTASEAAWKAEVERNERIGDLVNVEIEWQKEKWAKEEKWAEDAQKAYVKVVDDRVKAEAAALEKQQKEWQHYWENVQDFTADTFYDLFKNIDDGWQGLLDRMKDWFLRWAAEIAAKAVVVNLQGVFGSNMATSGTGAGGIMNMLGIGKDIYSLAGGGGTSLYSMLGGAGGAGATFAGVGAAEAAAAAAGYGGLAGATSALGAAGAAEFGVGASAATSAGMGLGMTAAAAIPYIGAAIAAAGIIYSIASKEKEKKYPVQPIELSGYSGGITGNLWSGTGPYTSALNKGYTDILKTTNEQIMTMIGSLSETQAKRAEAWLESYTGTAMRGGQVLKAGDSIESVLAEFGDAMESVYAGLVSSLGFDSAEAMAEYIGKVTSLIQGSQNVIASAINAGLESGGFTTFQNKLREGIYDATMQGLIDAFVSETVMGQAFGPFMKELQAAMDYSMSTGVFNAGAFMYLMREPLAEMSATISSLAPAFAVFSSISEQFQSAIGMQGGGVISEPITGIGRSGQLYRFGESGPETVTPGAGGGMNVTINAGVITTNDVDAWLADRMRKLGRRGHIAARNEIVTAGLN